MARLSSPYIINFRKNHEQLTVIFILPAPTNPIENLPHPGLITKFFIGYFARAVLIKRAIINELLPKNL